MKTDRDMCKEMITTTLALGKMADTPERQKGVDDMLKTVHHTVDVLLGSEAFDQLLDEIRAEQGSV